ncbi:hypothetical protein AB0I22_29250 [Streptomyces sp. NPDC050610]
MEDERTPPAETPDPRDDDTAEGTKTGATETIDDSDAGDSTS